MNDVCASRKMRENFPQRVGVPRKTQRFRGEIEVAPPLLKKLKKNSLTLKNECLECANRNPITERTS